ncbi:hypothetical protein L6164_005481 [Bauhinia variegata]|uniref:Uncharacterized protein n=1 Tax=Bauhinia variegata TaxID=167791 RepID=A0ACB9PWV6_BAUVA|nr:hypothetical protein L6164_005481 [Bauhinia variegata]
MITVLKGTILHLPWTEKGSNQNSSSDSDKQDFIKGALMIIIGCVCWSCFVILHAITLRSYPAELSLTAWICLMGAMEGTVLTLIIERNNPSSWSIHFDSVLLAYVYSGVVCSGVGYFFQGVILKDKGPVFVSVFSPLSMVIVAIMASFVLGEEIYTGRVSGAFVIVIGLYLVLWGKSRDQQSPHTSPRRINSSQMNSSNLLDLNL